MTETTKTQRVVLGGLARNCAKFLPSNLEWLTVAHSYFHPDSKFLFITNDSSDKTPKILEEFSKRFPPGQVKIYCLDGLAAKKPSRTDRLAFCRNLFLNHIQSAHSDFDLMFLADLDNITAAFDPTRVLTCFDSEKVPADWSVLTAATSPNYYDIWALRSQSLGLTHDCWDAVRHTQYSKHISFQEAIKECVDPWRIPYTMLSELIEVESAFGGLALYRLAATIGCSYTGLTNTCSLGKPSNFCLREICEHVPFHQQMRERNGAHIYIYPPLFVVPIDL